MQTELVTKIHNQAVELRVRDLQLNALAVSSGAIREFRHRAAVT
jgi:hypothetical protein